MACKKYTVTNNNTETVTFAYQKCSNTVWVYDAIVAPGQTKSVWLIDNTFSSPSSQPLNIIDDGSFPPDSTPTRTVTPTRTPTPTCTGPGNFLTGTNCYQFKWNSPFLANSPTQACENARGVNGEAFRSTNVWTSCCSYQQLLVPFGGANPPTGC